MYKLNVTTNRDKIFVFYYSFVEEYVRIELN